MEYEDCLPHESCRDFEDLEIDMNYLKDTIDDIRKQLAKNHIIHTTMINFISQIHPKLVNKNETYDAAIDFYFGEMPEKDFNELFCFMNDDDQNLN